MALFSRKSAFYTLFVTFLLCFITGCADEDTASTPDTEYFAWIQEESMLVDVKIEDNNVQLFYSICFDNRYDHGVTVSSVVAKFSQYDLLGWLHYQDAFVAETTDGCNSVIIPPETKMSVTFIFQGEYLGGEIDEDLRFASLVYMVDHD